jgi:hypothetical protein
MADEPTNVIMEQLHILRRGQEALQASVEAFRGEARREIADMKVRMTGIESTVAHFQVQMGHLNAQVAM